MKRVDIWTVGGAEKRQEGVEDLASPLNHFLHLFLSRTAVSLSREYILEIFVFELFYIRIHVQEMGA